MCEEDVPLWLLLTCTSRHSTCQLYWGSTEKCEEVQKIQAQNLFQVTFVDLQLIINSMGSKEINTKEFAASPSS